MGHSRPGGAGRPHPSGVRATGPAMGALFLNFFGLAAGPFGPASGRAGTDAGVIPTFNFPSGTTMNGLMMHQPLLISSLLTHAERHHGDRKSSRAASKATSTATPIANSLRARAAWPRRSRALGVGRRPRRHAGLERLPASRAVLRGIGLGRRAAHDQPAPASRPDRLDRRSCRGPDPVLRPDVPAAGRGDRAAREDHQDLRRDDRPRAHAGRDHAAGRCSATRS